jgi:hypothetical protein
MKKVRITWKAFGDPTYVEFDANDAITDQEICTLAFRDTNLYNGPVWDAIKDTIPKNRTHTSLSVGDEVRINDVAYRCEPIGWSIVDESVHPTDYDYFHHVEVEELKFL